MPRHSNSMKRSGSGTSPPSSWTAPTHVRGSTFWRRQTSPHERENLITNSPKKAWERDYEPGTQSNSHPRQRRRSFCEVAVHRNGSCVVTAAELQEKLADLAPGETLLLSTIEVEQAFPYERNSQERRAAAIVLAAWYRCSLALCGPGDNQVRFTRHDSLEAANFR